MVEDQLWPPDLVYAWSVFGPAEPPSTQLISASVNFSGDISFGFLAFFWSAIMMCARCVCGVSVYVSGANMSTVNSPLRTVPPKVSAPLAANVPTRTTRQTIENFHRWVESASLKEEK